MNQVIEAICGRKSIRKFTGNSIDKSDIQTILKAAMNAPSACNQQIWQFVVIDDRETLNRLASMHSGISFLKNAALAIVVSGQPEAAVLDYYWEDDCAAATQNMLLAIHALGLGATWSGVNRKDAGAVDFVRKTVNIPPAHIPFAVVGIGHPNEQRQAQDRYQAAKVHYNSWGTQWHE